MVKMGKIKEIRSKSRKTSFFKSFSHQRAVDNRAYRLVPNAAATRRTAGKSAMSQKRPRDLSMTEVSPQILDVSSTAVEVQNIGERPEHLNEWSSMSSLQIPSPDQDMSGATLGNQEDLGRTDISWTEADHDDQPMTPTLQYQARMYSSASNPKIADDGDYNVPATLSDSCLSTGDLYASCLDVDVVPPADTDESTSTERGTSSFCTASTCHHFMDVARELDLYLIRRQNGAQYVVGGPDAQQGCHTVTIGPQTCTCRCEGSPCQHLVFVMVRILGVTNYTDTCHLLQQQTLNSSDVTMLVNTTKEQIHGSVSNRSQSLTASQERLCNRRRCATGVCCVCFRSLSSDLLKLHPHAHPQQQQLYRCKRAGCRQLLHQRCMAVWLEHSAQARSRTTTTTATTAALSLDTTDGLTCPQCSTPLSTSSVPPPALTHVRRRGATRSVIPSASGRSVLLSGATRRAQILGRDLMSQLGSDEWRTRDAGLLRLQTELSAAIYSNSSGSSQSSLSLDYVSAVVDVLAMLCSDPVHKVFVGVINCLRSIMVSFFELSRADIDLSSSTAISADHDRLWLSISPLIDALLLRSADSHTRSARLSVAALVHLVTGGGGGGATTTTGDGDYLRDQPAPIQHAMLGLVLERILVEARSGCDPRQWRAGRLATLERLLQLLPHEFSACCQHCPPQRIGLRRWRLRRLAGWAVRMVADKQQQQQQIQSGVSAAVTARWRHLLVRLTASLWRMSADGRCDALAVIACLEPTLGGKVRRAVEAAAAGCCLVVDRDVCVVCEARGCRRGGDVCQSLGSSSDEVGAPRSFSDDAPCQSSDGRDGALSRSLHCSSDGSGAPRSSNDVAVCQSPPSCSGSTSRPNQLALYTVNGADSVSDLSPASDRSALAHVSLQKRKRRANGHQRSVNLSCCLRRHSLQDQPVCESGKHRQQLQSGLLSSPETPLSPSDSPAIKKLHKQGCGSRGDSPGVYSGMARYRTGASGRSYHTPAPDNNPDDDDGDGDEDSGMCESRPNSAASTRLVPNSDGNEPIDEIVIFPEAQTVASTGHFYYTEGVHWMRGSRLGSGSFSVCHQAWDCRSGLLMAVKQLSTLSSTEHLRAADELQLLARLRHQRLLQLLAATRRPDRLCLFVEWEAGGSVQSLLERFGSLSADVIRRYGLHLMQGLAYLHDNRVVHRDLKGANLLVDSSGQSLKIADLGSAAVLTGDTTLPGELAGQLLGTVAFMAPEVVRGGHYGRSSDVWSAGCCVIEMATGRPPWHQWACANFMTLLFKIADSQTAPALPSDLADDLRELVIDCHRLDQRQRPRARDLLHYPCFKSVTH